MAVDKSNYGKSASLSSGGGKAEAERARRRYRRRHPEARKKWHPGPAYPKGGSPSYPI